VGARSAGSFFAIGAAVVMWQINALMTVVLIVPMLLSSFLMEALGTRTMEYRAASRAATKSPSQASPPSSWATGQSA